MNVRSAFRFTAAALALSFAAGAAGCLSVRVDESTVFAPPPRPHATPAADVAALDARWTERIAERAARLSGPVRLDMTVRLEGGFAMRWTGEPAPGQAPRPLDRDVRHGLLTAGADATSKTIAWSLFTPPGAAADRGGRPLVVHCSGNAGDRHTSGIGYSNDALPWADVLVFDYPGYGDSGGRTAAADFEAASQALSTFASDLADERPLVFWGHSLGGFVCARLAEQTPGTDGLIIETSARDAAAVARAATPAWARAVTRPTIAPTLAAYDNARAAVRFGGPTLVLGAGRDRVLPVDLHRDLAETIRTLGGRVVYVEAPEASHVSVSDSPVFKPAMDAFFASLRPSPSASASVTESRP